MLHIKKEQYGEGVRGLLLLNKEIWLPLSKAADLTESHQCFNSPAATMGQNGPSCLQVLLTFISLCCLGTSAQGSPLLASLPLPGRPLQPQLNLKHLMPFKLNGSSPLSLFPNFNTVSVSHFSTREVETEPLTL